MFVKGLPPYVNRINGPLGCTVVVVNTYIKVIYTDVKNVRKLKSLQLLYFCMSYPVSATDTDTVHTICPFNYYTIWIWFMIISPRLVMANKGSTIFQEGDLCIK